MSEPESPANSTHKCFPPRAPQEGPPLFQHGNIVFQAHDVGWIVTAFFTIIATVTSFWLINKHLQWYTNKAEQRYIVRLLFMVPIYANISLASYLFWNHSTPLLLLRDAYEAILLTAFFYLLLTYLSPNPDEQKAIFRREGLSRENDQARERRGLPPKKWVFPLSFVKWKPQDGLYFLQLMKYGVLQYCVVRPVTTFFAVVLNYIGWYCETSWSPAWGHIWITGLISISVTIGMYCLLQLYLSVATELVPYRPVLKLFAVKAVVFLTFWQATFLSLLTMFGVVKDTPYMTAEDINIGWGAILETFEMTLFAFLHIKAFSYKPYRRADEPRTPRFRSLFHAMDFRDTFRELGAGWVYMWRRMRGIETDTLARREAAFENVSGKTRMRPARDLGEKKGVGVAVDSVTEVNGERQWLGVGDEYGYGLGRRERSEAFNVQVEKELTKKGYSMQAYNSASRLDDSVLEDAAPVRRHRSLWRRVYDRVSQTNADANVNVLSPSPRRGPSRRQPAEQRALIYDDLPPPSIMRTYRDRRSSRDLSSAPMPTALPLSSDWYAPPAMPPIAESSSNPPPLVRSDSLFGRLFPHGLPESERSHSVQSAVPPPSSQSHHTQDAGARDATRGVGRVRACVTCVHACTSLPV
ncbi:DUF300-domain-containing protein [Auriscalpium vulgare]|uniref:DUF300-domain-containing protein n=1 Tax=Auriscalpium vulgare TaxID=40419 RepID=A0ACB8SBH6_9AGAM|nr:DUF300-domain-containing protein [Auriscalpium vulgare]